MKRRIKFRIILYCLYTLWGSWVTAETDHWLQQRWMFKAAQQAVADNDKVAFERWVKQLKDYPTTHYLEYEYLKSHLDGVSATTVKQFLKKHKESPAAVALQQAWLTYLAHNNDWATFLEFYTPQEETTLQCHYLNARIVAQHPLKDFIESAKALWLVGTPQPAACDPVFAYLEAQKVITDELRWQRIHLALPKGQFTLANQLAKNLPKDQQVWVPRWQKMYETPAESLKTFDYTDAPLAREILNYGLRQLARKEAVPAYAYWKKFNKKYAFTKKEQGELSRYIILRAVDQRQAPAFEWITTITKEFINADVLQAKLQLALLKLDWKGLLNLIKSLSLEEQKQLQWRYWRARALEQLKYQTEADKLFNELAGLRDYYGFLAADHLQQPYQFQFQPTKINKEERAKLLKKSGIIRARELYLTGSTDFADKEWQQALKGLKPQELPFAATLAHEWGWYHQAIKTLSKAKVFDDLTIRFPLPYYDTVLAQAETLKLDYAWIYAVMRQESAFRVNARSEAGALGLMQLMPDTAKEVAKKQKIDLKTEEDVLHPETNIRLGLAYLRYLLDRFNGNHLLATVAYNAGPTRAKRWSEQDRCLPPDVWVELIPFDQTRDYVQRVMSYTPIFEYLLVQHPDVDPMPLDKIEEKGCD